MGEHIRAAYQLCQAISDDLRPTDIEFQAGSLVQLYEVTKALTEQLNGVHQQTRMTFAQRRSDRAIWAAVQFDVAKGTKKGCPLSGRFSGVLFADITFRLGGDSYRH